MVQSNKPDAERRVNVAQKRSTSLERRLATQQHEMEALDRDKQQLAAEVQRLSAALNSSNIRHNRSAFPTASPASSILHPPCHMLSMPRYTPHAADALKTQEYMLPYEADLLRAATGSSPSTRL